MLSDDIPLNEVQIEIPSGIMQGSFCMKKTMQPMSAILLMPVIQEIIMKQCSTHQRPFINICGTFLCKLQTFLRHPQGMIVTGY